LLTNLFFLYKVLLVIYSNISTLAQHQGIQFG
ncbi:unnamed protein product, partial [marine sediment metagenome]